MEENLFEKIDGGVTAPLGFKATGISCGLKNGGYKDIGLILSEKPCEVAASFTSNKIKASPVLLDMSILKTGAKIQAIIANSGNANCLNGKQGDKDAIEMVESTEKHLELPKNSVLVASTGPIGEPLVMNRVQYGIEKLSRLIKTENKYIEFSNSIMTTDTRKKNFAYEFKIGDKPVKIGISAKGSGMIKPKMKVLHATMLTFISTDINIEKSLLEKALQEAIDLSFNRINVDNDTSTNDSVILMANGMAENTKITQENENYETFKKALVLICQDTAKMLTKDGEGANKLIELTVEGAVSTADAKKVVLSISESYLVKTALFGNSPNWGRILAAIGYSGAKFDLSKLKLVINGVLIFQNGEIEHHNKGHVIGEMANTEITILADLGVGSHSYFGWTCDLTYDYVKINAHYYT